METCVHACITGKLLILSKFGLYHSIRTTLLCKYFLRNLKIFICYHFIVQNVKQGLILKTPNRANPVEFTLYILHEGAVKQPV